MSIPARAVPAVVLSALFLAAWRLAPAEQDATGVQVRSHAVAGTVHYLEGRGGNIGVCAGPDGLLIVDDQFADLVPRIRAALDQLDGKGDGTPRYVLNTHFHGDHTGGNPAFGRTGSILAHENVRRRLIAGGGNTPPMEPAGLPVVTYQDGIRVHFNGEELRVVHYPACHTDGDSVVFFTGSDAVHLGDMFFNGLFPFIDLDSGGSVAGLTRAIADVLARIGPATKIIPGHGPLAARADLQRYHDMLARSTALVKEALEAGNDVEAMLADGLLAEYESLSWQFVDTKRFLQTLARELSAQ